MMKPNEQQTITSLSTDNNITNQETDKENKSNLLIPKKSRAIRTTKPRPYLCSICTRGFVRKEHLKRHSLAHTNEKPFKCLFCGRCFARKDLVLRHQRVIHSSLMSTTDDQENNSDISTNLTSNAVKNSSSINDANIVKIEGNTQNILPANNNIQTDKELIKEQTHVTVPLQIKKRPRHASFSASSEVTYTHSKEADIIQQKIAKQNNSTNEVPHQVGFSTPQISFQELIDAIPELQLNNCATANITDMNTIAPNNTTAASTNNHPTTDLPEGFISLLNLTEYYNANGSINSAANNNNITTTTNTTDISNNATANNTSEVPYKLNTPFLLNSPSLSNLLLMNGGTNGFTPNQNAYLIGNNNSIYNINNTTKDDTNGNKNMNLSTSEDELDYFNYKSNNNTNNGDTNTSNALYHIPPNTTNNNTATTNQHWLADFIYSNFEDDLELDLSHFNDIGFDELYNEANNNSISINSNAIPRNNLSGSNMINLRNNSSAPTTTSTIPTTTPSSPINSIPTKNNGNSKQVPNFFRSRQMDLFKKQLMLFNSQPEKHTTANNFKNTSNTIFGITSDDLPINTLQFSSARLHLFTHELRQEILQAHHLTDSQFPTVEELNQYVNFYNTEFHPYFDFIHLYSIQPSLENHSLLTSIACIGSLYNFHLFHGMQLFSISRHHIRQLLEKISENEKEFIPLWIIQSMVMLTFVETFHNDINITSNVETHLKTLIKIVHKKQLNVPLEKLINPPIKFGNTTNINKKDIDEIFQYFIKAQSRIRTCHTILCISNLFTSLVGLEDCCLHSIDLKKSGVPCYQQDLYHVSNSKEWYFLLTAKYKINLDSKFSLVELSNGGDVYAHCLIDLTTTAGDGSTNVSNANNKEEDLLHISAPNSAVNTNTNTISFNGINHYLPLHHFASFKNISYFTLLSMLISIHEKIGIERSKKYDDFQWLFNSVPIINQLLHSWETLYTRNGGILVEEGNNNHNGGYKNISLINNSPKMKLILPLLNFAKIRKCLNLVPIMNAIWLKDWETLNRVMDEFIVVESNVVPIINSNSNALLNIKFNLLRDAAQYSISTIKLWIDIVSIMQNARKTSMNTPIFAITCIFTSIIVLSVYLQKIESVIVSSQLFPQADRQLWLQSEIVLKKLEQHLLPKGYNMESYAEFLRLQANGALDVEPLDDELAIKATMNTNTPIEETFKVIKKARLSSRTLYLGVRILADAPIWPIALLFAQALQARSIHINKNREK
ncbi:uncharacterized protein SCODWIG_03585 [Saccharomycodes ludwigii]|uniref:C2H2-type domain-containing protein n=2 Tax=Saccharomycodes ludwigii TaxID=36035 RepID=A0A376BB93_9ASCO|nr:uncharacterized protein SCODWIG_03585 [Saccharomycodes ludwigii]